MSDSATISPTAAEPTATPVASSQAPVAPPSAPAGNNGSQAQTQAGVAPSEDTFYSGDITKLPPQLQEHYKNMLTDYKKKTQAIAEQQKRFADVEKKAKNYDNLTKDQRFKEYWQGLSRTEKADFKEQKAEAEKRLGEKITDEEFGKAFESKDSFMSFLERVSNMTREKDQKKIESLEQKVGLNEAANVIESVASEMDRETKQPLRPDFYALDEDQLISGYLSVNPAKSQAEYRDRVTEAYNWAKSVATKYTEKGKAEALKIIQTKAQNSTEPPTVTGKGSYSGPDPKKVDAQEAVALARKGVKVPHSF